MKMQIYQALVNRVPGISYHYHKVHDNSHGAGKLLSWAYLLLLNFGYYVLFLRFLGRKPDARIYESKNLPLTESESQQAARLHPERSVSEFVRRLSGYDLISFDVFDTLIFRPFDAPTDLFFLMDEAVGILDFHRIRIEMEAREREEHFKRTGNYEISLRDIWERIRREAGPGAETGMQLEMDLEMRFCYANPFMLQVYRELLGQGKRIVITTDMYLPADFLRRLLDHCGYTGYEHLYVSNACEKSKARGDLYELLREDLGGGLRMIHVGDNEVSDVKRAAGHGFDTLHYPNINQYSLTYRAHDMSAIIGSACRGIVDAHLYCGTDTYSMEYEYGFIYGGLFVTGYCSFIHEYCRQHGTDRLLFLSRDGDILKQVYDLLYPGEDTRYVLWGRLPATKLMADANRYDFFRRFLFHKTGEGKTAARLLAEAELEPLAEKLGKAKADTVITPDNVRELQDWLLANWDEVLACYGQEAQATRAHFAELLAGSRRAAAIDIGWAGSGAVSLAYLAERVFQIPCEITGIVAGTNTVYNAEEDASEGMLQSTRLTAYLYSQRENRDLLKKHDPNRDYNVYWELLLSSPEPKFLGYAFAADGSICPRFGKRDENQEGIREIQRGILDFAKCYQTHFGDVPDMMRISGRDAYAPMLAAASGGERYLKEINKKFKLEIGVNGAS